MFKDLKWKLSIMTALGLGMMANSSQALMVVPSSLERLVACGPNTVVIYGKLASEQATTNEVGWDVTKLNFEGEVLKGYASGTLHPNTGKAVVAKAGEKQNIDVTVFGQRQRGMIKGCGAPSVGTEGLFFLTGPSPSTGIQGFCGCEQGIFTESVNGQGEKVMSNSLANKALRIESLNLSNSSGKNMEVVNKSLRKLQANPSGPLPSQDLINVVKQLIANKYGA